MKLLALLIVHALRRLEGGRDPTVWRNKLYRVLLAPASLIAKRIPVAATQLLLLVVFWAVIGFLIRIGFSGVLLSVPLLVIYIGLLWVCLGRDHLGHDLNEYLRRWYLRDDVQLRNFAEQTFGVVADSNSGLHRGVLRALFVRAFREGYAWIIVFACTGLPGLLVLAVLDAAQRASVDERGDLVQVAQASRARLDDLLVRLLGSTLLLTGNAARAWPILESRMLDTDRSIGSSQLRDPARSVEFFTEDPACELLADLCVAASDVPLTCAGEPDVGLEISEARSLLLRTHVVWIMLMAVSVIIGF